MNGHVFPEVEKLHIDIHYKDRAILYQNLGDGKFKDVTKDAGPALSELHSARGAAFGDIDNDGTLEVAVNNQNEAPSLFKQAHKAAGHWLILKLRRYQGKPQRDWGAGESRIGRDEHSCSEVRSGGSYLSQSDLRLHFGLGNATKIDSIEIFWPGGGKQALTQQAADQVLKIKQAAVSTIRDMRLVALILSAVAVASAQNIQYDESRKVWLLTTHASSYAMGVSPNGQLQNLYWGGPLWRMADVPAAKVHEDISSFDPHEMLDAEEYPGWGGKRFYEPALKVTRADGDRDLVLVYQSHKVDGDTLSITLKDIKDDIEAVLEYRVFADAGLSAGARQ